MPQAGMLAAVACVVEASSVSLLSCPPISQPVPPATLPSTCPCACRNCVLPTWRVQPPCWSGQMTLMAHLAGCVPAVMLQHACLAPAAGTAAACCCF